MRYLCVEISRVDCILKLTISRCDDTTKSDLVSFSNFLNAEDRKMPRFCGKRHTGDTVKSDGAFFRVTFRSNHIFDAKGFQAVYSFTPGE